MSVPFFDTPILNSPYRYPDRHWELDEEGQPTGAVLDRRRPADFVTPIPKPRRQGRTVQPELGLDIDERADDSGQQYRQVAEVIGAVRAAVNAWRKLENPTDWKVTPETQRLLQHWRHHDFAARRPFFCQVEAIESIIWLTEVAPKAGVAARRILDTLADANEAANPGLSRAALKLATGAGKTTVMAMLIAWQTINAVRRPGSTNFTKGFLVVAPGLTIRDRLRVLLPNDPDSYYRGFELVPPDLLPAMQQARVVITNYHAFKRREKLGLAKGSRRLLEGRDGRVDSLETDGEMLQRVVPELMGFKRILVLNDEAHHCYREKPAEESEETRAVGDELAEAKQNAEAARLWIGGLEAVRGKLGLQRVIDLSATPFFLAGSGYREGTLFPWTMTDFSLMDAIECGIVKLPRVPVADNTVIDQDRMPIYRELWEHIREDMPRKGRGGNQNLSPEDLPKTLLSALDALYGHYAKTFELWEEENLGVPPCFIVVCSNTAASKLIYDYVSGYEIEHEDGSTEPRPGRLELFRNTDEHGNPESRMRTLLIDSYQLESGDALDADFRKLAAPEIKRFQDEIVDRTGDRSAAENLTDADLLREAMNTVGKPGRLGEQVRCVVSVSMLTEGWDANNVTHVLGVRAFSTQLLCEQVIGRALRRQSYELNDDGRFDPEYADVLGIPFDFTAQAVVAPPQKPIDRVNVRAVSPTVLSIRMHRSAVCSNTDSAAVSWRSSG